MPTLIKPLYTTRSEGARGKTRTKPAPRPFTVGTTRLEAWFERDRANVTLEDADGNVLLELWDDDARAAFKDGFLSHMHLHRDAVNYANHLHGFA